MTIKYLKIANRIGLQGQTHPNWIAGENAAATSEWACTKHAILFLRAMSQMVVDMLKPVSLHIIMQYNVASRAFDVLAS